MADSNTAGIGFEKQIWDAACVLRGNIDASEYKSVVLGLIFLKYISDRFDEKHQQLVEEGDGFEEDVDEYISEGIFFVPETARWSVIASKAHTAEIGTVIDDAMRAIEKENRRLKDILPKNFARPELDNGDISAEEAMSYLHIFTYQNRECTAPHVGTRVYRTSKEEEDQKGDMLRPEEILYYVFDEAHYFLADAVLNNRTNQWLDLLTISGASRNLDASICLFLTATPEPLYRFFNGKPFLTERWQDALHKAINTGVPRYKRYLEENMHKFLEALSSDVLPNMRTTMAFKQELKTGMEKFYPNSLENLYEKFGNPISEGTFHKCYYEKPDYSYIQPVYFKKYEELLEEIRNTGTEKWLIFVDNEVQGMEFARLLEENGLTDVGVLSRRRINGNKESEEIYQEIVEDESFSQHILITTSVLDCGINIDDEEVSNVVIACDNKTGFLQMLGRKRVKEGEKVRLFIKAYSYNAIRWRYDKCIEQITVLNRLSLKNATKDVWDYYDGKDRTVAYLSESEQNMLHEDIKKMPEMTDYKGLVHGPEYRTSGHLWVQNISTNNVEHVFAEYSYSRTAFLSVFTQMREYQNALNAYHTLNDGFYELCEFAYFCFDRMIREWGPEWATPFSQEGQEEVLRRSKTLKKVFQEKGIRGFKKPIERDDAFYLKRQLAWIDKEYDESCWLGHTEKQQSLLEYLAAHVGACLGPDEQVLFIQKCLHLMIQQPKIPDCLRADISRYTSGKLVPKKNKLNSCFRELGIPYEISSAQKSVGGKRQTYWIVRKWDVGEEKKR